MSHYTVAVFTDPLNDGLSVDALLAPFNENIQVERYLSTTRQEAIDYERKYIASKKEEYDQYLADPEKFIQENFGGKTDSYQFEFLTEEFPKRLEWDDEQCYQHYVEHIDKEFIDEETGDIYSTYNPDSKWDWYSIGGRWGCELFVKEDCDEEFGYTDEAFVRNVDFARMRADLIEDLTPYQEFMVGDTMFKKEYLQELYPDEETYIQKNTEFSTFAVLTPDGEWHEPGSMGWFGCSSETPEENTEWHKNYIENFIKPAIEKNWYLTIVDCHI